LNPTSQQCPHCNVSLIAQATGVIPISSRFDEATTLAWECPFCHKTDVIPGMETKWADFVKDQVEIWEAIDASKDHERKLYAAVPENTDPAAEPYPGCYEAYKDDPECDDNHPRHKRGIALRFVES
jgi:ssDNA-binding Zn-finger/Zn-ribbon topoisomerase 1